jgi:prolipoprotein diacylglyceryl transferase
LAGIFAAVLIGNKRFVARGGGDGQVADIAIWAVPFGVIGGRLYHVLTDWSAYFGVGGKGFLGALRIWEGGLGIWGAIALGALGAVIGCRRHHVPFPIFADAVAPGVAVAQAMGRWGNWFNQELFGKPLDAPWALEIDAAHRPTGFEQYTTFHPTFLYESLACLFIALAVVWADKRFQLSHGRVFALYVAMYCAARGLIETLRIDEAHHILGVRLNVFTALIVGFVALLYMARSYERHPVGGTGGRRRSDVVEPVDTPAPVVVPSNERGKRRKGR